MKKLPIVALVGQTNAGKSSLLNRLARKNIAIVAREEGTTRDNVVARIDNSFILVDTAGLKDPTDDFEAAIQEQIEDAIESADAICVVLDASKYPDFRDREISKKALRSRKPVWLVLNKCDLGEALPTEEFRGLGIKEAETVRVSATTGQGASAFKRSLESILSGAASLAPVFTGLGRSFSAAASEIPLKEDFQAPLATAAPAMPRENGVAATRFSSLTLALIGRPNVGKSSLFNALGKKQQAIVSSRQGTTRDVNRLEVRYKGRDLEILDTAGLRRPGKREVGIEQFSAVRTLGAIEEADVCALLIDATEPHAKLDQALAGQIIEAGKGIVVVVTKTDLVDDTDAILDELERDFNFLPYAPVLLTSAGQGKNVTQLMELALQIDAARHTEIKTAELNKILAAAVVEHAPAGLKNTHPSPKYIVQTDTCPPWLVVHGHGLGTLHWSWKRYLERKIREKYPFVGTPIMISYRDDGGRSVNRGEKLRGGDGNGDGKQGGNDNRYDITKDRGR